MRCRWRHGRLVTLPGIEHAADIDGEARQFHQAVHCSCAECWSGGEPVIRHRSER